MLSEEECDVLDKLSMSALISITTALSSFAVPEAVTAFENAMPKGYKPTIGFGSHLADRYHRAIGLNLPVDILKSSDKEKLLWKQKVAALIAAGLLGSAYEELRVRHNSKNDPLWEFFRHCRNACFHGNRFHFRGQKPKHLANWRGLEITHSLQGTELFFDFLQFGDIFCLLSDIMLKIGMPPGERPMFPVVDSTWKF